MTIQNGQKVSNFTSQDVVVVRPPYYLTYNTNLHNTKQWVAFLAQ